MELLEPGMEVLLHDGTTAPTESITPLDEPIPVYNIEVDGIPAYFAGEDGVLVHNCKVKNVTAKPRTPDDFLDDAMDFLGDGPVSNPHPGRYTSGDRAVRFTDADLAPTHGNIGPHGHFEIFSPGSGATGKPVTNIHIPLR